MQADGKILLGGDFTRLAPNGGATVTRNRIARLNPDGTLDASFNPNADRYVDSIAVQADGNILIGGGFSTLSPNGGAPVTRNRIARLETDGTLDRTLDDLSMAGNAVLGSALQPDGKILIGGLFSNVLGVTRNNLARLNPDGTLDISFDPNADNIIYPIAVQADGKILIGGNFSSLSPNRGATVTRNHIARLNPDGTLDASFDPNANDEVDSIVVQADGKILICGRFSQFTPNGGAAVDRNNIARLNTDGTVDASFDPNADNFVYTIALQADGKILIGGNFFTLSPNGGATVTRNYLARLNPDGTVDNTFDPKPNGEVYTIAAQADGKILIGGQFTTLAPNGGAAVTRQFIARLNPDGALDTSFDPNANGDVFSIAPQADGKILIGGQFSTLAPNGGTEVTRQFIARLNPDGTVDTSFDPSANNLVFSIAVQADGKILVGGVFSSIGGQTRNFFARLTNGIAALQDLAVTRTSITWTLGGASPQFSRVTFEYSTDNVNYSFLGSGTRSGNIWSLTGLSLSALQNIYVRARGYYPGGYQTGSENIRESIRNAYPAKSDQTITVGTHAPASAAYDASFTVAATSDSGLAVSYSSSGVCTNVGATFTMTGSTGTCTVKYDQAGDANYNAATQVTESVAAQKANQTITVNTHAPASAADNASFTVAATSDSGLVVSYSSSGVCTNVGATFTMTSGTGACTVKYDQAGDANYNAATQVTESVTAQKANQLITVNTHAPANATYNTSFTVAATSNSGLAVAYSSSGICTSVGATFTLTSGTGTCTVKYDQSGNGDYSAAQQVTESVTAQKDNQTITFGALANRTFGDADFAVSAIASSNLAVSFSASGNCTLSGSTVHLSGAGSCTITASQAGDSNYNAAANVSQSFNIAKANQTITFNALSSRTFGDADFAVSATASSNLAVNFSALGNCTVSGSTVHLSGAGSCTITASQAGDSNYNPATNVPQSFNIAKANQTITFNALSSRTFGDADFAVSATASSNLAVSFSALGNCTVSGSTVHLSGAGSCTITASQAGDSNYNPATNVAQSFSIAKANQTITFGALANKTFGDADFAVSATASSNLAVSFSALGNCTVSGSTVHITGAGSCTITASQAGDSNYNAAANVPQSFSIAKANETITFGALANKNFGDADFSVSASASSGLAVSFAASGQCTLSGNTAHITAAGSCTITASQSGDSNYNPATNVAQSFSIAKANQTITFNALSSRTFGDADFAVNATASSNLAVSFSASGNCTVSGSTVHLSGAGSCTITAAQAGDSNYNPATNVPQSFNIAKANQTITFGALPNRTFGDADFAVSASASSGLAVNFSASGNCTISGTSVHLSGAGSCTITASQAGDSNYIAAANIPQSFNISKAATTTAVTSSLNPSNLSQSVTFTAAVSSIAGTPTGTVQFKDNGSDLGPPVTLNGSGMATFSTSSLTGGTHTITSDYSGDVNFSTSAGTLSGGQTVNNNRPLISFSQSSYTVSEDAHFLNITVNRAGDTSSAVNVDYTTDDANASANCATLNSGLASARCDFTPAFGTLRFAANETTKTFPVLITQDSHVEGPEMFNLNLSNLTGGAAFVAASSATVTITDGTAVLPANAIDDPTTFVRQHYHDFLNREPDQAGLDFWVGNFTQCNGDPQCLEVKRINVSAAFFLSIEFQQTGYLVERIYKTALGDALGTSTFPSSHTLPVPRVRFNEFLADTQTIGRGVVVGQPGWEQQLESNKQAFTAEFAQRGNFPGVGSPLSNAQFVDTLNSNAGNPLSQSERDQLIADLNNSSKTRAQALRVVAAHPNLATAEFNRAFVLMQFFGYLRRNPDDPQDPDHTGYDFWLTKLNQFNGNFQNAEMVKAFISSIEYRRRFGQ